MRAYLPAYELCEASGLADALALMASEPGSWHPFAGGTDLMVLLESGVLPRGRYLNIWNLPELRGISADAREVAIGALTTYSDVRHDATLARPAVSPSRTAAPLAATSPMPRPPPIRRRHCSSTMRRSSCDPSAASVECRMRNSIEVIRRWTSPPTS
jgi:hypothetical protein